MSNASAIALCNRAVARLGGVAISSFSEGSKEAQLCAAFLDASRDAVLRDHKWNFATARRVLAQRSDTVAPWSYCYTYPTDCLAAREIYNPASTTDKISFEVAMADSGERIIFTNQAAAILVYTRQITDYALCDPLFLEALSWKLATEIAVPLTMQTALMQSSATMYRNALSNAITADANEGEVESVTAASWLDARLGLSNRGG